MKVCAGPGTCLGGEEGSEESPLWLALAAALIGGRGYYKSYGMAGMDGWDHSAALCCSCQGSLPAVEMPKPAGGGRRRRRRRRARGTIRLAGPTC